MKPTNSTLAQYGTTIFEVMSRLAREHGAINLGQGFPEGNGPAPVVAAAAAALTDISNQYPPMLGLPELRQAVAAHDRRFYGLEVDWATQTMVTSGATEALAACLFALIEPGDEVVVIEPLYDSYLPIIRRAGGIPRSVRLNPPDWSLPEAELTAAFGPKTKLILYNTPMNPSAKVFTAAELALIARLVEQWDCYALCDEVYEHILFDGRQHIPLLSLPGMAERAIKIGSAGKTFSLTGWKVGYLTAAPALIDRIARAHQFLVFTTPPNLQAAVAAGLNQSDEYYTGLIDEMQAKRDRLAAGLERCGLGVLPAEGTYFLSIDVASTGFDGTDEAFCRYLTQEVGVAAIPVGAFYASAAPPGGYARFCFAKRDEVLDEAVARIAKRFGRA
ncbi:MAG: aminotransferase [Alphaproteobacteria bacterium]|nr:aminotransferase [Alphaproteobacteria bacterium]